MIPAHVRFYRIYLVVVFLLIILFVVEILLFSMNKKEDVTQNSFIVAASIFPVSDMISQIAAGTPLQIINVLPSGASPHTFEMTPRIKEQLSQATILFSIGHGLDDWATQYIDTKQKLIILDRGISLRNTLDGGEGNKDPHYWLSYDNALLMVGTITVELDKMYPAYASVFEKNSIQYSNLIREAKENALREFQTISPQDIVTLHDGWEYFVSQFGFFVSGVFETAPGKEPSPRYFENLGKIVKEKNIKVLFTETELSNDPVKAFAQDNTLKLVTLDPLGGVSGRDTYLSIMQYNVKQLKNAF